MGWLCKTCVTYSRRVLLAKQAINLISFKRGTRWLNWSTLICRHNNHFHYELFNTLGLGSFQWNGLSTSRLSSDFREESQKKRYIRHLQGQINQNILHSIPSTAEHKPQPAATMKTFFRLKSSSFPFNYIKLILTREHQNGKILSIEWV